MKLGNYEIAIHKTRESKQPKQVKPQTQEPRPRDFLPATKVKDLVSVKLKWVAETVAIT